MSRLHAPSSPSYSRLNCRVAPPPMRAIKASVSRPVAWRSIFTAKGLDAPAVFVTDVTAEAAAWADEHNLSWNDLLYARLTRARYACTVLRGEGAPWRLASDRMHVPHREGVRVLGGAGLTPLAHFVARGGSSRK